MFDPTSAIETALRSVAVKSKSVPLDMVWAKDAISKMQVSSRVIDFSLAIALFWGALAARLPYLMIAPAISDEFLEVQYSLNLTASNPILLTNYDPYYGSLFNYLIAFVFYVFGPSAEHARLAVAVLGALTVPLAYFFAKLVVDRAVGLTVALMMITSGALIVSSHLAWENSITPFFATATLLFFTLALKRRSGKLLVLSGFIFGLTLQTHPGAILFGIGLGIYFIYAGLVRDVSDEHQSLLMWLKSPWPYLALIVAQLGYANLIAANFFQDSTSWTAAQEHTYALELNPTFSTYFTNMQNFLMLVLQSISSSFNSRRNLLEYATQPANFLYLGLLAMGIGYAIKRKMAMPVVILLTTWVLLPYFNKAYTYPISARYIGYLFPILYLLVATPLVQAIRSVPKSHSLQASYLLFLVFFLVFSPVLGLQSYYAQMINFGPNNVKVLSVDETLRQEYLSGAISQVILDDRLAKLNLENGGNVLGAFDYVFNLEGTPYQVMKVSTESVKAEVQRLPKPSALILFPESIGRLASELQVSPLEVDLGGDHPSHKFEVYIVE